MTLKENSNTFVKRRSPRGYLPIDNYALIGNLRTVALVSIDASIDFLCLPTFDSPSVFARLLDANKGGYFHIFPVKCRSPNTTTADVLENDANDSAFTVRKQQYLPNSNVLKTKFQSDTGVVTIDDWMPRPLAKNGGTLVPWTIRKVHSVQGTYKMRAECFPAFDYAQVKHKTTICRPKAEKLVQSDDVLGCEFLKSKSYVLFEAEGDNTANDEPTSGATALELHTLVCFNSDLSLSAEFSSVEERIKDAGGVTWELTQDGHDSGTGAVSEFVLSEGMTVYFILKQTEKSQDKCSRYYAEKDRKKFFPLYSRQRLNGACAGLEETACKSHHVQMADIMPFKVENMLFETTTYWQQWHSQATYTGRWRETVQRSALALKLLVYEPTGAMVASPTFSLPESIGGTRNWDYRYTWIRDSAFTVYAFLRLGMTEEAEGYMGYIFERCSELKPGETLSIMYTIHGEKCPEDLELSHLEGYRGSRPVRIGNSASGHLQLDIYGALLDAIYLYNKFARPVGYDMWLKVRSLVDYVAQAWHLPDNSIWEIRDKRRHYTYSKVMCWVALDRGIRLADKRSLPCPSRQEWYKARDLLYEEIMEKGYNDDMKSFVMGYDPPCNVTLDSSVLIMAMTFFVSHTDPRLLNTLFRIMKRPEEGGLLSNGSVYRYNLSKFDDNIVGEEGTFSMCTFWLIEALTRAGKTEAKFLNLALDMFEQIIGYGNHLKLFSEEIALTGESLGNHPQAFTHIALISTAFNLDRQLPRPGNSH